MILHAIDVMNAPIKIYDEDHNEIPLVISIDLQTGEIMRALKDKSGNVMIEYDKKKQIKTEYKKYKKFSIEYNEPGS